MSIQDDRVRVVRVRGYDEYRVSYRGLVADREEAMAYYTDDREDAEGTAEIMRRDALVCVFRADVAKKGRAWWPELFPQTQTQTQAED